MTDGLITEEGSMGKPMRSSMHNYFKRRLCDQLSGKIYAVTEPVSVISHRDCIVRDKFMNL